MHLQTHTNKFVPSLTACSRREAAKSRKCKKQDTSLIKKGQIHVARYMTSKLSFKTCFVKKRGGYRCKIMRECERQTTQTSNLRHAEKSWGKKDNRPILVPDTSITKKKNVSSNPIRYRPTPNAKIKYSNKYKKNHQNPFLLANIKDCAGVQASHCKPMKKKKIDK